MARGGEGVVEVGEDVVCGERDELAATEEDLAEETVGIIRVGEADEDACSSWASLVDLEHGRRSGRQLQVTVADPKEASREVRRIPPPRDGPDLELVVDDDSGGVLPLRDGSRELVRWPVELHGVVLGVVWI